MADDLHPASPLEALNARGLTAKREYVRGLEQRHDPEALSLLTECLCDESWFLRDLAEQAFFRLGEAHADVLVPLLAGGLWYTRMSAARLLGRIGYRPAVPALLELCGDGSETVAAAAREAIVAVARQRAAGRIAHALHRLAPTPRQQRLAEVAERDPTLAKKLERMMADVDLMADDHPDRLVDSEEPAAAGATRPPVAPKAPRTFSAPVTPAAAAARPPATRPPPAAGTAAPKPKPLAVATGEAPKPRAPRAPAGPAPGGTRKPLAPPGSAAAKPAAPPTPAAREPEQSTPQPEVPMPSPPPDVTPSSAPPPPATTPPPTSTSASPAPHAPPAAPEPGEAPPGS